MADRQPGADPQWSASCQDLLRWLQDRAPTSTVSFLTLVISGGILLLLTGLTLTGTVATWLYRYFSGRHPVGSDRVDYPQSRIAHTANHMKDYAREYGGCLPSWGNNEPLPMKQPAA